MVAVSAARHNEAVARCTVSPTDFPILNPWLVEVLIRYAHFPMSRAADLLQGSIERWHDQRLERGRDDLFGVRLGRCGDHGRRMVDPPGRAGVFHLVSATRAGLESEPRLIL